MTRVIHCSSILNNKQLKTIQCQSTGKWINYTMAIQGNILYSCKTKNEDNLSIITGKDLQDISAYGKKSMAKLVWFSWLEPHPGHQRVADLIPSQGSYLRHGFSPQLGHIQEATNRCFSLSLSLESIHTYFLKA